ncbi:MAG: hypothetical protein C4340_07465 [Armatimonadota bacterium]
MNLVEGLIEVTQEAVDDLFRYARSMPEEWLEFQPGGKARTVMSMLRECAGLPAMIEAHLRERPSEPMLEAQVAALWAPAKACRTIDECEALSRQNSERLYTAMREADLTDLYARVMMPWGKEFTLLQLLFDHYWNLTYHLGQVGLVQLMHGDDSYH